MTKLNNLPQMDGWMIQVLSTSQYGAANTNAANAAGAPLSFMGVGSRNDTTTSMVGAMHRRGASPEVMLRFASAINASIENPMPESEVRAIVNSVAKYPAGNSIDLQDIPLSRYVAALIRPLCRYVPGLGWAVWDVKRWRFDGGDSRVTEMVKRQLEAIYEGVRASGDPERTRNARTLLTAGRVKAIKGLIESDACLHADVAEFDARAPRKIAPSVTAV